MKVLGMISGTSHDGIDAALVDLEGPRASGDDAGVLTARVLSTTSVPYDPALRARLVAALPPADCSAAELCALDTLIGQAFADVAAQVAGAEAIDLVGTHGQTIYHWVTDGHARGTLQIGQPAWIAEALGVPVVADLRSRDVAAGGHGAPLVPLLDEWLLADSPAPAASLNLGGIANVTLVRPDAPSTAYDLGPANALVDAVVHDLGLDANGYDTDGRLAARGEVDADLLASLLADPYYRQPAPKSTGKEYFNLDHVRAHTAGRAIEPADLVATLTRLTAEVVGAELRAAGVQRVVAAGGGCDNPVLMAWIAEVAGPIEMVRTDSLGLPAAAKEAIAFALLAWCTWHGLPGNVPSATGASGPRVLGALLPGRGPLRLPEPLPRLPRLVIAR